LIKQKVKGKKSNLKRSEGLRQKKSLSKAKRKKINTTLFKFRQQIVTPTIEN
jgi:hypothetical protein